MTAEFTPSLEVTNEMLAEHFLKARENLRDAVGIADRVLIVGPGVSDRLATIRSLTHTFSKSHAGTFVGIDYAYAPDYTVTKRVELVKPRKHTPTLSDLIRMYPKAAKKRRVMKKWRKRTGEKFAAQWCEAFLADWDTKVMAAILGGKA